MTLLAFFALLLGGAAVASLAWAFALPRQRADARMAQIDAYGYTAVAHATETRPGTSLSAGLVGILGGLIASRLGKAQKDAVRRELLAAGFYNTDPRLLLGHRVIGATIGVALGALAHPLNVGPFLAGAMFGGVGWMVPLIYVRRVARFRLDKINRALPDLIDLLVVMIEAGSGFGAALEKAARRTGGPLGDELRLVLQEQRFGRALDEAMRNMLVRADTPNMQSFVRGLTQGESLGVSIGTIMRNLAQEMRVRRRQAAEEQAQKAPVKMLFPLVFCILPALLAVILAPAAFEIFRGLGS